MQFDRYQRLLLFVHSGFVIGAAAYIAWMYPSAWTACLILSIAGLAVASMPQRWRQRAMGEVAYLIAAVLASLLQWYVYGNEEESVNGLSRIILVSLVLVLVPNRPGQVRSLAMLVALELLLLDKSGSLNFATCIFLSCFAMAALFLDAWLRQQQHTPIGVRIRNRFIRQPWIPLLIATITLLVVCYPFSTLIQHIGQEHRITFKRPQTGNSSSSNNTLMALDEKLQLGSALWSDQDPYVVARFFPDRADDISSKESSYFRAMCVPNYTEEANGMLSWNGPKSATPYTGPPIANIPLGDGSTFLLNRTPDKLVLRPDGSDQPVLENFYFDSEGNIYASDQDLGPNRYRCGRPSDTYIRTRQNSQAFDDPYLEVPSRLTRLFQQQIPQLEQWRVLRPNQAAQQIFLYLQGRCRYKTKDLPIVDAQPSECMNAFLFGEREERIGHCQYFATAATLLMRSCGHATRPVFGFASNELDETDGKSLIIRAWHAHAWTEYIDDSGNWRRLDCTPPDYLSERVRGAPKPDQAEENDQQEQDIDAEGGSYTLLTLSGLCVSMVICVIFLLRREEEDHPILDARQQRLAKEQQALLNLAKQLGISVKNSHTLSHIVTQLELCSGLDLQIPLTAHLAARYHQAELPPPWPVQDIRQAAQKLAQLRKNAEILSAASASKSESAD